MRTARQFPVDVAGDKSFAYAVMLADYAGLKRPNDKFNYYDIMGQQDALKELATKRFELLALRDDIKYILKHTDDFKNADGTSVDREQLAKDYDEVVNELNTMQTQAAACSRDATQCTFSTFEAAKFKLPVVAKGPEDAY